MTGHVEKLSIPSTPLKFIYGYISFKKFLINFSPGVPRITRGLFSTERKLNKKDSSSLQILFPL